MSGMVPILRLCSAMLYLAGVLVALGALSASRPASATADGPDHYRVRGVSPSSALNLRAGPSADSERLGRIPSSGTCLRNLGCQGGLTYEEFATLSEPERRIREARHPRWCKVVYRGLVGWVAGRYLAEGPCP
jgi:uncharacterized protein YraI